MRKVVSGGGQIIGSARELEGATFGVTSNRANERKNAIEN